jgi:hypothetical protein
MSPEAEPQRPASQGNQVEEGRRDIGEVRKGADMMFTPPTQASPREVPMPLNMAPEPPVQNLATPAADSGGGTGSSGE